MEVQYCFNIDQERLAFESVVSSLKNIFFWGWLFGFFFCAKYSQTNEVKEKTIPFQLNHRLLQFLNLAFETRVLRIEMETCICCLTAELQNQINLLQLTTHFYPPKKVDAWRVSKKKKKIKKKITQQNKTKQFNKK